MLTWIFSKGIKNHKSRWVICYQIVDLRDLSFVDFSDDLLVLVWVRFVLDGVLEGVLSATVLLFFRIFSIIMR